MPAGLFLSTFLNSVFPFLQCALTEIQLVLLSGSNLASSGSLVELARAVSSLSWSSFWTLLTRTAPAVWLHQMISKSPFQPQLFWDSVKHRDAIIGSESPYATNFRRIGSVPWKHLCLLVLLSYSSLGICFWFQSVPWLSNPCTNWLWYTVSSSVHIGQETKVHPI